MIVGTDDMPADALSVGSVKVVIVPVCSPGPAPWKHVLVNVASAGAVTAGLIFLFADKAREKLLPGRAGSTKIAGDDSEFAGDIRRPDHPAVRPDPH